MKTFFKEYGQLCKSSGQFFKKHWLGTIVMMIVSCGLSILIFWPKELKEEVMNTIKDKFKKDSKEEEA